MLLFRNMNLGRVVLLHSSVALDCVSGKGIVGS